MIGYKSFRNKGLDLKHIYSLWDILRNMIFYEHVSEKPCLMDVKSKVGLESYGIWELKDFNVKVISIFICLIYEWTTLCVYLIL